MSKRLTSKQAGILILVAMRDKRIWKNDDLRNWIEKRANLSKEDRRPYPERDNEEVWYSTIDNALAPSRDRSLTSMGLVNQVSRGNYIITAAGLEQAEEYVRQIERSKAIKT